MGISHTDTTDEFQKLNLLAYELFNFENIFCCNRKLDLPNSEKKSSQNLEFFGSVDLGRIYLPFFPP